MSNAEYFQAFYVDISQQNAVEIIQTNLEARGLVTFDQVHSVEDLRLFCSKLGKILMHRDSDKYGVTQITKRELPLAEDGYQAFTNAALTLHTDGSSLAKPATLVVFWCAQPGETGGLSLFVDGKQLYELLSIHHPAVLQILTKLRSAIFAGAEPPLTGAIFNRLPGGRMQIRFRYDSLGYYAAPVSSILPLFLRLLDESKIMFALQKHQGYILQNGRWLHGRTAFSGDREAYRVLLQSSEQQAQAGFDVD